MHPDLPRLLPDVLMLARTAGRAILGVYAASIAVTEKDDRSPLTEADLQSEAIIAAGLRRLTPDIPVLSEETSQAPFAERAGWDWLWVVDPLDGTREFINRNGEFTVNIALVRGHRPVLGVVHAPALDRDYYAAAGLGAFRADAAGNGRPVRVAARGPGPVRIVGSRSHRGDSLDAFLERVGPHQLVAIGSSLKFCLVAEGAADVYPRLGPTSEWDTAAGQCVVEQAGGQVVDLAGQPLTCNARAELLNPHFVAWADSSTDWLSLLR